MGSNRLEEADFRLLSQELNIPVSEIRRAVHSFFGSIVGRSRLMPFDDERRIYSKEKFEEYVKVWNLPSIGRMGPVYSRYLRWRANESRNTEQELRSNYRSRLTQSDIENTAEAILSGKTPPPVRKKRGNEMYKRVWLVGRDGKKLARQVIPKKDD